MSNFTTRMIAQVVIQFDTGSEYGGKWTFEAAHEDAKRAIMVKMQKICSENGVKFVRIESVKSHCMEMKS